MRWQRIFIPPGPVTVCLRVPFSQMEKEGLKGIALSEPFPLHHLCSLDRTEERQWVLTLGTACECRPHFPHEKGLQRPRGVAVMNPKGPGNALDPPLRKARPAAPFG